MVSLRFVQFANCLICSVERSVPSRTTANGLPKYGTEVKTSNCLKPLFLGVDVIFMVGRREKKGKRKLFEL